MNKKYNLSLFIFRRDLRLNDNTALIECLKNSKKVITCFIFDVKQITNQNIYKSNNAIQFMIESLQDLQKQLLKQKGMLNLFYGQPTKVIDSILKDHQIDAVYTNRDYTPFSLKRDEEIKHICHQHQTEFEQFNDLLLTQPEEIKTVNGDPYTIFTPFYKNASRHQIDKPINNNFYNFYNEKIKTSVNEDIYDKILNNFNKNIWIHGGTTNAYKILLSLNDFKNYVNQRDYPSLNTTNLSAHLKFGTCSIRETYHAIKKSLSEDHLLIKLLFWRDFFTHIAYFSPFVFGHAYKNKYDNLKWIYNDKLFEKWKNGQTGFPIVDAGMRQLKETGFMHNRVRMITASFLIKDMHINWLEGEKYFAQNLIDYDPAVNNGNWQWVASTGADAQPYFRIFNPWLQQKKIDSECIYIKKWIPEFKNIEPKIIHNLFLQKHQIANYPKPILDHSKEIIFTKKIYSK